MLFNIVPLVSQLSRIQEIPSTFFQNIEASAIFDDNLFPAWTDTAFAATDLKAKFKTIYNKYKLIADPLERLKIRNAFLHGNQIQNLCNNQVGVLCIELNDLDESIRTEIDSTFQYLYKTAINYHGFTEFVNDNLSTAIDRFILANDMQVCPFCGLEGYTNLEGQSRIALDHWLCIDLFPFVAVNFDNLIPIGSKCNERPAKGDTNILKDEHGGRIRAYYPFLNHHRINTTFAYINEPSIVPLTDVDWVLNLIPNDPGEQYLFDSWNSIFNILVRYRDYFRKVIHPLWENDYKRFIEDAGIGHADDTTELKEKFRIWRASFPLKARIASILYKAFIDNMINNTSEAYLFSLCENFKRA
jgi:hypothetical protein